MANSDNVINIGDTWKAMSAIQINIGDVWKDVAEGYINIGDVWKQFWSSAPANGDRGVFAGGSTLDYSNVIQYITISTTGNATDFGDLTQATSGFSACSNGTNNRGVFGGGSISVTPYKINIIQYITISTTGNATDFGDLLSTTYKLSACSNGTNNRGVFGGGSNRLNVIQYITISTTGNATDFGDLIIGKDDLMACSNGTNNRGVFAGGEYIDVYGSNAIEYITISTTGNATDFGDLIIGRRYGPAACSNGNNNRGCFGGGSETYTLLNQIDYITINTVGNATDFGDLTQEISQLSACSNGTNNRGVFGGGSARGYMNIIDVIQYITISTTGNTTDFGDLLTIVYYHTSCSDAD